ncbi:MAG TPA: 16S rRNA (guanine(966)-N(2))-methyltransferase RsmD [Mycobacteriales bacterium]|nr:16S rRNA (guanine(966)-N(2))-methyltransferase RsmD [Mycobacteriales bacterium]
MRVIAGIAGGRRIAAPPGTRTRPTADRTREAMFSTLTALAEFAGARVLDLYAGSGALGLEALSRGAASATFVESDPAALRTLRANVSTLSLHGAEVVAAPVDRFLASPRPEVSYDVVLADPPYDLDVGPVLAALVDDGWLAPHAVLAVERSARSGDLVWPEGLVAQRSRRYGATVLWYGSRS